MKDRGVVLITGASSGIGLACARRLAAGLKRVLPQRLFQWLLLRYYRCA